MASYNIFNYNYRPAKSIERKLFVELLKEIYGVTEARKCTYIGFGSIFFTDFKMIHKELGIKKMINIENKVEDKIRFEFNKPYSCIDLQWGMSTDVLLNIDYIGKKIFWLDYDETLQSYMFEDIETIFTNLEPGSFYMATCNSSLPKYIDKTTGVYKPEKFTADFADYVPYELTHMMMTGAQSPYLIRDMVNRCINHILEQRNAVLDPPEQLVYQQLLFLSYKDRAPMFSTGGLLLRRKDLNDQSIKTIKTLAYVKTGSQDLLDIQSPVLTSSEIDLINSHLPKPKGRFLNLRKLDFIPEDQREKYFNVYRYYPSYVEIRD